jgi:hypothetical protein
MCLDDAPIIRGKYLTIDITKVLPKHQPDSNRAEHPHAIHA